MKHIINLLLALTLSSCAHNMPKTANSINKDKFMGSWYVIAGRFTFLEEGQHNSIETYTWNEKDQRIDIDFRFNKDHFDGKLKSIPQKGFIYNTQTNAHWKVQPFWPLKLDYLVLLCDPDYQWTVIGVPSQKYVWIMAREKHIPEETLQKIIQKIKEIPYDTKDIVRVPQR